MKSLARRSAAASRLGYAGLASMVLWATALGQATPDEDIRLAEPSTVALFCLGMLGAALLGRRRK